MPKVVKYDGNNDPKVHLMQYKSIMELVGLPSREILKMFPMSLTGSTQTWYYNLKKRKNDETFTGYMARWRAKVTQMRNFLDTKEQIKIFIKGTLPTFREKLYYMPLTEFYQVYEVGTTIKDKIRKDKKYGNRTGRDSPTLAPLSRVFERVKAVGLLKPLAPRPPPVILPKNIDQKAYCYFHQSKGHTTDSCMRLRHEIQDLIDSGKVTDPKKSRPSTRTNPHLNFRSMPPSMNLYMVESGTTPLEVLTEFEEEEEEREREMLLEQIYVMMLNVWDSDEEWLKQSEQVWVGSDDEVEVNPVILDV
ncbi:uncharacterized protein LOC119371571 [Jatropha curcas]|uniref:uncharacterized protein LOC119371571 n=1 Tax=Jatropha curcas TaxID=180498 RepID=UPI001892F2D0|nr:uncharacterized protein LOC119371571 [Jatropha curcas]